MVGLISGDDGSRKDSVLLTDPKKGISYLSAQHRHMWFCQETMEMGFNVHRKYRCGFSRTGKAGLITNSEDWLV